MLKRKPLDYNKSKQELNKRNKIYKNKRLKKKRIKSKIK